MSTAPDERLPAPSTSTVIAGHECFRAALSALAHPGRRFALGGAADVSSGVAALVAALYETDTPISCDASWALPFAPRLVAAGDAQVLLVRGATSGGGLARAPRGSEEHPSHGATVVYAAAHDGPWAEVATPVKLRGPGVDGELRTTLALTVAELADRADVCAQRPLGVDVLLVGADATVCGLPRSTRVEVLD